MFIKKYYAKINILYKIYRNYNVLSRIKNYPSVKINSFVKIVFHIIFDKFLFRLFFPLKKKMILNLIDSENLYFSIRSANLSQKNFISNNAKKFNQKKNLSREISKLRNYGYLYLGKIFSRSDCNKFINSLENKKFYNSQTPLQSDCKLRFFSKKNLANNKFAYCTFLPSEFFSFRKLMNFLNSKILSDYINSYFNFKSSIYSALTWVNMPSINKHYVHSLHRDYDDFKFLVLIINWTAVTKNTGATRFIKKTHILNLDAEKIKKNTIYLGGKQGSAYLVDTFGLHSGTPLRRKNKVKVSTWIRFGKLINAASIQDGFVTTP